MKASGITRENGVPKGPPSVFTKSIEQGAATSVWCALSPKLDGKGGVYCEDATSRTSSRRRAAATERAPLAIAKVLAKAPWT